MSLVAFAFGFVAGAAFAAGASPGETDACPGAGIEEGEVSGPTLATAPGTPSEPVPDASFGAEAPEGGEAGSAEVWSTSLSTLGDGGVEGTRSTSTETACESMSPPGPGNVISNGRSTARPMAWMTPAPIAKIGRLNGSGLITAACSEEGVYALRLRRARVS